MTELGDAIKHIARRGDVHNTKASVLSVDKTENTCVVKLANTGEEIPDVKLLSIIDNPDTKFVIYPVVGSDVSIGFLDNDMHDAIVLKISEVDEMILRGDAFGGLVKADVLKTELDKTNALLNAIKTALTTWTPVAGDGGGALKLFLTTGTTSILTKNVGDFSAIKNDNIKHG